MAGLGTDGTLALLTRTIVQVGHDLGIEVVAEGIERPEQLELLRAMGCGLGQGYLVARPMAARGIEALAAAGEPVHGAGEPGGGTDEDEAGGHDTGRQPGPPAGHDRPGGRGEAGPTGAAGGPDPAGAGGPAEPPGAPHDAPAAAPAT